MTPSKALVSFWTPSRSAAANSSDSLSVFTTRVSNSAYFSRPFVRLQTMETRAAPRAPDSAAALPPPGAGASEPSFAVKSLSERSVSFMSMLLL